MDARRIACPWPACSFGQRYGKPDIALLVLRVEVDENPATRRHLWILLAMILVSFGIEFGYRRITGRRIQLVIKTAEGGAGTMTP